VAGRGVLGHVISVTIARPRRPALWWFPYGSAYQRLMAASSRALHGSSLWMRLRNQVALARFPRFWRRVNLGTLLKNIDKLV
jgi:hypothetical protein